MPAQHLLCSCTGPFLKYSRSGCSYINFLPPRSGRKCVSAFEQRKGHLDTTHSLVSVHRCLNVERHQKGYQGYLRLHHYLWQCNPNLARSYWVKIKRLPRWHQFLIYIYKGRIKVGISQSNGFTKISGCDIHPTRPTHLGETINGT